MNKILGFILIFSYSMAYGQIEMDFIINYHDFAKLDTISKTTKIEFFDQSFKDEKKSKISLSQSFIYNDQRIMTERRYNYTNDSTFHIQIYKTGENGTLILDSDTRPDRNALPSSSLLLPICRTEIMSDDDGSITEVMRYNKEDKELIRHRYKYDLKGRIILWEKYVDSELRFVRTIKYYS